MGIATSAPLLVAGLLGGMTAATAAAVELGTLVMPGPVARAHAEAEAECKGCHRPFDRAAEPELCLVCHEDVGEDQRRGKGFHGRFPAASGACRQCHPDHRGRDADLLGLDAETFDHTHTDFTLTGAHGSLACAACHSAAARYREAPGTCAACHRRDDAHAGQLGEGCGDCHATGSWRDARFDHDETRFSLSGRHRDVACGLCHRQERYRDAPSDCIGCHRLDDAHRRELGDDCGQCHSSAGWKSSKFDHSRDTTFPLRGSHQQLECPQCHIGPPKEKKLATDCISCHRRDDVHEGRNGTDCARCHDESRFTPAIFRHARDTDFPLRGGHADLACATCHVEGPFRRALETTCVSCHGDRDPHAGQEGEACDRCHGEQSWTARVAFDHDLAVFPLLGLHAAASCEECHAGQTFQDADTRCIACHAAADVHEGRLTEDCARCHNPNGWPLWSFDHATQTSFALHGAHEGLACRGCHTRVARDDVRVPKTCAACHSFDDIHRGGFGRDCARCHEESSWRKLKLGREGSRRDATR